MAALNQSLEDRNHRCDVTTTIGCKKNLQSIKGLLCETKFTSIES
jgi:hypothetical protein